MSIGKYWIERSDRSDDGGLGELWKMQKQTHCEHREQWS